MEIPRSRSRKKLVRGDPIVRRVLGATLEELARVGYHSLRIEDVAARAKVNKTTVYRRWPAKMDLVRTALLQLVESRVAGLEALPDHGSLREDLLAAAKYGIRTMQMPDTESLLRIAVAERADRELIEIGKAIQSRRRAVFFGMLERAKARGELSGDAESMMLILDMLRGALIGKMFIDREIPDEEYIRRVVDLLLSGALHRGTKSRPPESRR